MKFFILGSSFIFLQNSFRGQVLSFEIKEHETNSGAPLCRGVDRFLFGASVPCADFDVHSSPEGT